MAKIFPLKDYEKLWGEALELLKRDFEECDILYRKYKKEFGKKQGAKNG